MKRWTAVMSVVVGLVVALGFAPPASAAPYCGITWGSLAKEAGTAAFPGHLTNIRAGRHTCYDRLVLDVAGGDVAGYRVEYVSSLVQDGSGEVVPLRGGAKLSVVATVGGQDAAGNVAYVPANRFEAVDVRGWQTFRQVFSGGSYEGLTQVGLGVRARLPFRVFVLDGPGSGQRLVVDVAHRW